MNCDCEICKLNINIDVPEALLHELVAGNVVIFAGAGISTESRRVLPYTLYEYICGELGIDGSEKSFPGVMEDYSAQTNGRAMLLDQIRRRLEHIDSFPELQYAASSFHRELGTLYLVDQIVTTNWDTYFERICKATPFVTDPDVALWNAARRKVLKIHGSISNLGSIVATNSDYAACLTRLNSGIIGSLLKNILATKTVIFIGYSLRDSDFQQIYEFVRSCMNNLHRQAYVVSPFPDECKRLEEEGFLTIGTDGTHFLRQVKTLLVEANALAPDEIFEHAAELREIIDEEHRRLHSEIKAFKLPEVMYAAFYQDGLAHAMERAIHMRGSGEYSHPCRVRDLARKYVDISKKVRSRKQYVDSAYVEGYINGLIYLGSVGANQNTPMPPFYFAFGVKADLNDLKSFKRVFSRGAVPHKAARMAAQKSLAKLVDPSTIEFHHPPWLSW